jgi:hypothetical protein
LSAWAEINRLRLLPAAGNGLVSVGQEFPKNDFQNWQLGSGYNAQHVNDHATATVQHAGR